MQSLRARAAIVGSCLALGAGCLGLTSLPDEPLSFGTTSGGVLHRGVSLDDRGEGFVRARPGESTRFGTPTLVSGLERAIREVARRFPGSAPMRVGDLSGPSGGRHPRHASHRSGRDVDLLFYVTDPAGRSRLARGWLAYNRFGFAIEHALPEGESGGPAGGLFFFDDARNWWLVRTLVLDEDAAVQWIFVSHGVKSRLLRWGEAHEEDPRALVRASYALQQPSNSLPHDDHFHVRVLCGERELAHGCENRGPIWPWLRDRFEKPPSVPGHALDDERLVEELLAPIDP